jgi:hypothetical protein
MAHKHQIHHVRDTGTHVRSVCTCGESWWYAKAGPEHAGAVDSIAHHVMANP